MFGRLVLVCALVVLIAASARTAPLQVSLAQPAPATSAPTSSATSTATVTPSPTPVRTPSPAPTASVSPTAAVTPIASRTPTASAVPTGSVTFVPTLILFPTWTPTTTRTPTRTSTPTTSPTPTSTRASLALVTLLPTSIGTPISPPTVTPPLATDISASSITRSGATITWTTNVLTTSQVELATDVGQPVRSVVDASLVTSHRQVVTGLAAGATYHFKVRSATASGALGVSGDSSFVTAPEGSGPELVGIAARRVTATTALLDWTTSTGNVAQVEYGATANYGAFTLLKIFAVPAQRVVLTGLQPATIYHYRVKAWDGAGYLSASGDFTFTTAPTGLATLLGDQTIQSEHASLAGGQAAAYEFTATQTGLASVVNLYLDAGTTANVIRVALYADQAGAPGPILAQSSAPGLTTGWTTISIPPVAVVQGQRYWVAVLSPIGAGAVSLRDAGSGGSSLLSRQTTLAAFPLVWTAGIPVARSPLAVYVQQVPPAVTLTGPADGVIVTGRVPLAAVVDDDAPIARVQFFVDGTPVGTPLLSAPYTTTWDSTGVNASQPHAITAQASDMRGRLGVSGAVTVQVDNGPRIAALTVTAGLTASSARVNWATDMLADAQVEYGPTTAYGSTTPIDSRAAWSHEMQLTGLQAGATYHYRVLSRDANGAVAISNDATFATPEP